MKLPENKVNQRIEFDCLSDCLKEFFRKKDNKITEISIIKAFLKKGNF